MRRVTELKLSKEGHQRLVKQILGDETYALRARRESAGLTVEAAADSAVLEKLGSDPVFFATLILGLQHAPYQKDFLNTTSKRVVLRWPRQSGKSRSLAAYSIWFAATHPATNTLIVAPSWRQSSYLHGIIQGLLDASPRKIRRALIKKRTRTITQFRNESKIMALPNSAHLLRGFTTSLIILDEAAFFNNDEDMFLNILPPMLSTTGGTMVVSSTPWGRNTQFYRINNDPSWQILHVTWKEPAEAGIYTTEWSKEVEKIRETSPMTYQTEYEAEFTEDVDTWLTQDILAKSCNLNVEYMGLNDDAKGELYAGLDLAEVVDYCAFAVVRKNGRQIDLIHMHRFPLKEKIVSVLGYINILCQKWKSIGAVYVDNTKQGKYIINDMNEVGIPNPVGINFSTESKQEMAQILRERLTDGKLRLPFDRSLLNELNVEQYQLTKTGKIAFSHLSGTHDDRFWALALATYAATKEVLPQRPIVRSA
jgi:phage terminase large subunit-like protein